MKVSHTPGPWKVSRRFDIHQDLQSVGGTYIGTTRGNHELPEAVALVDEANARLIAAAPELLSACEYLLDCIYAGTTQLIEQEPEYGQSPVTAFELLKDAVKKATIGVQSVDGEK